VGGITIIVSKFYIQSLDISNQSNLCDLNCTYLLG